MFNQNGHIFDPQEKNRIICKEIKRQAPVYEANIAIRAKFMGTILISDIVGSQNVVGAQSDDGLIRREPPTSFADTQTKVTGCGLYIKKGLVLG